MSNNENSTEQAEQQYTALSEQKKERIIRRVLRGRAVNMPYLECEDLGIEIARSNNHSSFRNYESLMNDKDFILRIATITPNPLECEYYFYQFINPYILNSAHFQTDFIRQIYKNENVYKLADYASIAQLIGAEQQHEKLLKDPTVLQQFQARLQALKEQGYMLPYRCSGKDKVALREYKVKQNENKVAYENKIKGLKEIIDYVYNLQNPKKDDLDWR